MKNKLVAQIVLIAAILLAALLLASCEYDAPLSADQPAETLISLSPSTLMSFKQN